MPRARSRRRRLSLTSLIDVIFLLLLFFMLSSTFTRFAEVELTAGAAGVSTTTAPPVFLQLRPDAITLNGDPTTLDALGPALASDEDGAERPVLVSMSPDVAAQRLTDLLVVLRGVPGIRPTVLGGA